MHNQITGQRRPGDNARVVLYPGQREAVVHTFRHVFCSFLANRAKEKASAFQVMKLMGNSGMEIVLSYFQVDDRELAAAVGGVDFGAMLWAARQEEQI